MNPPSAPPPAPVPPDLARAIAEHKQGRLDAAEALYRRLIADDPTQADALQYLGMLRLQRGDVEGAIAQCQAALRVAPAHVAARANLGMALLQRRDWPAAQRCFEQLIDAGAASPQAWYGLGNACLGQGLADRAIDSYRKALAREPAFAAARRQLAKACCVAGRWSDTLEATGVLLRQLPDDPELLLLHGTALARLHREAEALASLDRALARQPDLADALYIRGQLRAAAKDFDGAVADFDALLAIDPERPDLPGTRLEAALNACDWRRFDEQLAGLRRSLAQGRRVIQPFGALNVFEDAAAQRRAAEIWSESEVRPSQVPPPPAPARAREGRLRIGFFSCDFREHVVARLIAGLIEGLDRSRFECIAFSWGPDSADSLRQQLRRAFDRFIDIDGQSDAQACELARAQDLDIAVDLMGHTLGCRPALFALRVAPVQVNYLGYVGTTGQPAMDYLLADRVVVPPESARHCVETPVYLPCYQVNDPHRRLPAAGFTRAGLGLPESAMVYCCFNQLFKILPAVFDGWMRVLRAVPGSVLWLVEGPPAATARLRERARQGGVDPERLVFGRRLPLEAHMARYPLADLFLDTRPYNAGATASDALWAGVPVLTCTGESMVGRYAASLLHSLALPELVTTSPDAYEQRAIELGLRPGLRRELRERLAAGRATASVFDTARFTRAFEAACERMVAASRAPGPRAPIDLSEFPAGTR